jgi:hypothetical protein
MRKIILVLPLLFSACASSVGTDYTNVVGMIQTDWPQVEAAATIYVAANPAKAAEVQAIEAKVTPLVAALNPNAPATISAALTQIAVLLPYLPKGAISTQTQADITLGLALFNLVQPLLG